ncbi:MAG: transposase [Phycisphaerae bacterium]
MFTYGLISAWTSICQQFFPVFTQPTAQIFLRLLTGWVLCTGRRTITGIIPFADPNSIRSHDVYHRFFSKASWDPGRLWELLARFLIRTFYSTGVIGLDLDDTVFHHTGRKMDRAGIWRDAVRSTKNKIVYCWGLNLVVLTVRVTPPWGGEPIGLPILIRLHRKGQAGLIDLAEAMLRQVGDWFPDRHFRACADGFYASLAGRKIPRTHLVSRVRSDAAIYDLVPQETKRRRGPKRKKGFRLPTPTEFARRVRSWTRVRTVERGKTRRRQVHVRKVLWYKVSREPVLLVICRDPAGKERDDFFFTTDLSMAPAEVIGAFAGRWSIEDTFKNTKQFLGAEQPQSWKNQGPERAAVIGLTVYSLVWTWYLRHGYRKTSVAATPWYPGKTTPSFQDALAALRRVLWRDRIISMFGKQAVHYKISKFLIAALEKAA